MGKSSCTERGRGEYRSRNKGSLERRGQRALFFGTIEPILLVFVNENE